MDSNQVQNLKSSLTLKNDQLQAILAGRDPTDPNVFDDDESNRITHLMSEIQVLDLRASNLQMNQPTSRPILDLGFADGSYRSVSGPFKKFSDQLMAIRAAGMEGSKFDHRLYEVRTASGLSETIPSDSGFLVQPDFSTQILQSAFAVGRISPLTHQIPVMGNGIKINAIAETSRVSSRWGGLVSYWAAEAGTLTPSAPKFRQMELSLKKLICLAYATDEVLADASLLSQTISEGFQHELSFTLDEVCLNGTGVGQPLGIMQSACLVSVARQTAGTITIQDLANIWSRCIGQNNAVWLVNPNTLPTMFQMALTIGASGVPVYMPPSGISTAPYSTLFGRPVIPSEHCQSLGTKGDIVLGDFSQYLLAMKSGGTVFNSSMHVRFVNDETAFRAVLRVDGQPAYNSAIQPKVGSTLSPFVTLAT